MASAGGLRHHIRAVIRLPPRISTEKNQALHKTGVHCGATALRLPLLLAYHLEDIGSRRPFSARPDVQTSGQPACFSFYLAPYVQIEDGVCRSEFFRELVNDMEAVGVEAKFAAKGILVILSSVRVEELLQRLRIPVNE